MQHLEQDAGWYIPHAAHNDWRWRKSRAPCRQEYQLSWHNWKAMKYSCRWSRDIIIHGRAELAGLKSGASSGITNASSQFVLIANSHPRYKGVDQSPTCLVDFNLKVTPPSFPSVASGNNDTQLRLCLKSAIGKIYTKIDLLNSLPVLTFLLLLPAPASLWAWPSFAAKI